MIVPLKFVFMMSSISSKLLSISISGFSAFPAHVTNTSIDLNSVIADLTKLMMSLSLVWSHLSAKTSIPKDFKLFKKSASKEFK